MRRVNKSGLSTHVCIMISEVKFSHLFIAEFRQKNAGRKSRSSKAKEAKKSKKNEPAIENGVEEHKDADEANEENGNAPDS